MGGGMWGRWRRGRRDAGLAGIGVHASGLSFVRVVRNAQAPARIAIAEFRPYDGAEPDRVLARLVQHQLTKREEDGGLMTVRLDYHRIYNTERPLSAIQLETLFKAVREDALAYFEDIAEGERFDELSINRT